MIHPVHRISVIHSGVELHNSLFENRAGFSLARLGIQSKAENSVPWIFPFSDSRLFHCGLVRIFSMLSQKLYIMVVRLVPIESRRGANDSPR